MLKKHKVLFIILGLGVVYLLYLFYKNYQAGASSASSGAVDTSSLPTIISTGGGSLAPMYQQTAPQTFDATIPGTTADSSTLAAGAAATAPAVPSTATVMPGTSSSGVPASTDQAQEFNTNAPVATPQSLNGNPSYYATSQQLPYQQINQSLVTDTSGAGVATGAQHPDLTSFLQQDTLSWETNPGTAGNASDLASALAGDAGGYCGLHPEACAGVDQSALIQAQSNSYSDFMTARNAQAAQAQSGSYQNPAAQAIAPSGPLTMTTNAQGQAVWTAQNQQAPGGVQQQSVSIADQSAYQQGIVKQTSLGTRQQSVIKYNV